MKISRIDSSEFSLNLAVLAAAWPDLPEPIEAAIEAPVQTHVGGHKQVARSGAKELIRQMIEGMYEDKRCAFSFLRKGGHYTEARKR